ncbi:MAG: ABC transporter permease subunit, partial [Fusobacteriaceae bacterium]
GMMTFLITQMFPAPMLLLPMSVLLTRYGLMNKFLGLLIPYTATAVPFCVWMLKGYFDTIPKSLEESAYIDGCKVWQSFYIIILPLSTPALAISALFSFMSAWSEYVIARVVITDPKSLTLPVGLVTLQGSFAAEWGVYSAAALITSLPVVILFISLSRYLVGGLTAGGVKE